MKTALQLPCFCLFATLAIAVSSAVAPAASRKLGPADLLRGSTLAIDARVVAATAHWDSGRQLIFTTTTLRVLRTLHSRDPVSPTLITVETPGGVIGTLGLLVPDAARFNVGERAVVFLTPWVNGAFTVPAGAQGHLSVDAKGQIPSLGLSVDALANQLRALGGR